MNKAKDFQMATAERIMEIFSQSKHKRVLLSDEVGLGKTIVARTVVEKAMSLPGIWEDGIYWVVYVCSNQNIIRQNTKNLGFSDEEIMKLSDSRLSMQHLILQERKIKLGKGDDTSPKQLIPLTPATSFRETGGGGNASERALIFAILKKMPDLAIDNDKLSSLLKTSRLKSSSWQKIVASYERRVNNCGQQYLDEMHKELRQNAKFQECLPIIIEAIRTDKQSVPPGCINKLRLAFSQISLKLLQPDLVLMDEFQRFSDLLTLSDDTEEAMIAREFFANEHPYILLMSATPYKPFTTLEELNNYNVDEQYEDFLKLMNFLFDGEEGGDKSFNVIWEDYSNKLSHISTNNLDILVASKNRAEEKMYDVTCRTERFSESLIKEVPLDNMKISEGDILSYCQMQRLLHEAKKALSRRGKTELNLNCDIPIEYAKSSPYLLSFMQNYQEGKTVKDAFKNKTLPIVKKSRSQKLLLKGDHIYKYRELEAGNARLEALQTMLLNNHAERLLWIPASHPYYTVPETSVFALNKDFSKVLVFSAWEMVPRMLAVMLSYEAERRNVSEAYKGITYTSRQKTGMSRLYGEGDDLLKHPSDYLAGMYNCKKYFGWNLDDIVKDIEASIQSDIDKLPLKELKETSAKGLLQLIKCLEGGNIDEMRGVPLRAAKTLAYMSISSPAICFLRILQQSRLPNEAGNDYIYKEASDMASNIVALFNRRESSATVELSTPKNLMYYEQVLHYCAIGNLQAVLDEYCHMIDEEGSAKEITEKINASFIPTAQLYIDTTDSFCKTESGKTSPPSDKDARRLGIRRNFAFDYTKKVKAEKDVAHKSTLQQAFNSPFRPFVLATTSVGQEGLDFHWYARKIVHWNLPSNPVNMEQREGRINRYKCLAIRRNVAKFFGDKLTWKEMFDEADKVWRKEAESDYSEMVPYWCLPREVINRHPDELEYIERIVPLYPMSIDGMRYSHLLDVLALYRLTMGQPRQEELLHLLEGKVSHEQMKELLFDLSPYNHKKQQEKSI